MRVAVIIAHPDDEVIGCGGTIAHLADEGHAVTVVLPVHRCDPRGVEKWPELLRGFEAACDTLGAKPEVIDPPFPETQAQTHVHQLHDRVLPFVDGADLVLTHWTGDVNQVHRGVAHAVEIATRPFRRRRDVSLFEIATSTDQVFGSSAPFTPTQYRVLSGEDARRKLAAMALYPSEIAAGRTPDDLELRMRQRGAEIGVRYAEAFAVARQFR